MLDVEQLLIDCHNKSLCRITLVVGPRLTSIPSIMPIKSLFQMKAHSTLPTCKVVLKKENWRETQLTNSVVESAMEFPTQTTFYRRIRIRILVSELSASEFQHGVVKGAGDSWHTRIRKSGKNKRRPPSLALSVIPCTIQWRLSAALDWVHSATLVARTRSLSLSLYLRAGALASDDEYRSLARLREIFATKSAASSSCGCDQQAFIQLLLNRALEILQNHQTRAGGKKREGYY